jgi:hypothetical protein
VALPARPAVGGRRSPGIGEITLAAARRVLPLELGGQPRADARAIRIGLIPVDAVDRVLVPFTVVARALRAVGKRAFSLPHAARVVLGRDFVTIHAEVADASQKTRALFGGAAASWGPHPEIAAPHMRHVRRADVRRDLGLEISHGNDRGRARIDVTPGLESDRGARARRGVVRRGLDAVALLAGGGRREQERAPRDHAPLRSGPQEGGSGSYCVWGIRHDSAKRCMPFFRAKLNPGSER